jgi:hypothetical protein
MLRPRTLDSRGLGLLLLGIRDSERGSLRMLRSRHVRMRALRLRHGCLRGLRSWHRHRLLTLLLPRSLLVVRRPLLVELR